MAVILVSGGGLAFSIGLLDNTIVADSINFPTVDMDLIVQGTGRLIKVLD